VKRTFVWLCLSMLAFASGSADAKDFNRRIIGQYAILGETTCLATLAGFDSNFVATGSTFTYGDSTRGVATYNEDGTATWEVSNVSVGGSSANSNEYHASFFYNVAPDGSVISDLSEPITGTTVAGQGAPQTFTVDSSPFVGQISDHGRILTFATPAQKVEVISFSSGMVQHRICHRSRLLVRMKAGH
jgi:hypothetical protein